MAKIMREAVLKVDSFSKIIEDSSTHENQISQVNRIQKILIGKKPTEE